MGDPMVTFAEQLASLRRSGTDRLDEIDREISLLRAERAQIRYVIGGRHGAQRGSLVATIREIVPSRDEWAIRDLAAAVHEKHPESDIATIRSAIARSVKIGDIFRPRYGFVSPHRQATQ